MENKLFEELDGLNIRDTTFLLDKEINLSVDYFTRKRIEKSIKKKIGYYNEINILIQKINDILGGIFMKRKIALALSAGVILSLAGGGYAYAKTPVAYVSMDINPSVELGVNAFDKVVSTEAYNEDGKKVLEGTDLINSDVDNAVSTIISNAISDGYIKDDGSSVIEITTSTDKEKVANKLDDSLKAVADKTLNSKNAEAKVEIEKVALSRRDEARKLGITPGKLNLIQKLQELDPTISVEDYKSSSAKEIQNRTKELLNNKSNEVNTDENANTKLKSSVVGENTDNSSNNGNSKKEESNNSNSKNDQKNTESDLEKDSSTKSEKENNSNNLNSQNNNLKTQNKSSNKEKNKNN